MTDTIGIQGEALLRVTLALVIGMAFGLERLVTHHEAGIRTLGLVGAGCALMTAAGALVVSGHGADPTRIAGQVASGIGFLGAGAIFRGSSRVRGLTTAATVWVVAALGITSGFGLYWLAAGGGVLCLVVLAGVRRLERRFDLGEGDGNRTEAPFG